MTVEEARREVFAFINDCVRYGLRSVIILHGKGERNPDGIAQLKSYRPSGCRSWIACWRSIRPRSTTVAPVPST